MKWIVRYRNLNIWKTLLFNFKFLPFKQAVKLPILIHGRFQLRKSCGRIIFESKKVSHAMVNIGFQHRYVETTLPRSIWTVNGTVHFAGKVNFYQGSYVLVAKNADLYIGTSDTVFGSNVRIFCFEKIAIGNSVRISWDVQLIDTSFHYIEFEDESKGIRPLTKPVVINNRVWIGNRATISKGADIPENSIVASNSLVNKDLTPFGTHCLFAGSPAKLKTEGLSRVWDAKKQKRLDKQFGYDRTNL